MSEQCLNETDRPVWFAMSAPYRNELKAKSLLESKKVECFVPMHYEIKVRAGGVKSRELVPAINNLVFAHTTRGTIQEIKTGVSYLQYKIMTENGKNVPIVVPDAQMEQFMAVCRTNNEKLVYLRPEEVELKKGTRVRIIGGAFDGVEGVFVKLKGLRRKRVVVMLQGLAAVAMAEIEDNYIEVL